MGIQKHLDCTLKNVAVASCGFKVKNSPDPVDASLFVDQSICKDLSRWANERLSGQRSSGWQMKRNLFEDISVVSDIKNRSL